jgi:hypothetical protein
VSVVVPSTDRSEIVESNVASLPWFDAESARR